MSRRRRGLLLGLAACLAFAGSAPSAIARTWQAPQPLGEGEQTFLVQSVAAGLGETVSVYQRVGPDGSAIVARSAGFGMGFGREQVLGEARSFYPTAAADALGETFAAWYDEMDSTIRVAIRPPGGEFGPPLVLDSSGSDYSQGAPHLAASPTGAAVVAFLIRDARGQRMLASVRPAGGAFGPAEEIAPQAGGAQIPRDIAINDLGEVVAAYQQDGVAHVALRTPGALGTWQPPQPLGARNNGWSWSAPQVGIDATGGAVAIWQEGAGLNDVGPLRAAFRAPLGRFGAPQDLGIVGPDSESAALGVSALGEVILVARPAVKITNGVGLQPLVAAYGSTVLGRFGPARALSDRWWPSNPMIAMNARGDALLTYDSCCAMRLVGRRRAPLGALGPEEEIIEPLTFEGSRGGRIVRDVRLDELGNAAVTWVDFEPEPDPLLVSRDGPLLDLVPDVSLPSGPGLVELLPPAVGSVLAPVLDGVPPLAGLPQWATLPPGARPAGGALPPALLGLARLGARAKLSVAVTKVPRATGRAQLALRVGCSAACTVGVEGTLRPAAGGRALRLPGAAIRLDRAATAEVRLALTRPAARALRARSRGKSTRRFTLTARATSRDRSGATATAAASRSFKRRR